MAGAFYGIWMVTVVVGTAGLLSGLSTPFTMFITAPSGTVTWGLIDGFTFIFSGLITRTKEGELVERLRTSDDPKDNWGRAGHSSA